MREFVGALLDAIEDSPRVRDTRHEATLINIIERKIADKTTPEYRALKSCFSVMVSAYSQEARR